MVPFLEQVFARGLSAVESTEIGGDAEDFATPDLTEIEGIRRRSTRYSRLPGSCRPRTRSCERLLGIVADKSVMPNRRLLLFSTFRHTLAYLEARSAACRASASA